MSPDDVCVQCHETRGEIKRSQLYCATVDAATENGPGEVNAEWPRHRFKPYSKRELDAQARDEAEACRQMGEFADFVRDNPPSET